MAEKFFCIDGPKAGQIISSDDFLPEEIGGEVYTKDKFEMQAGTAIVRLNVAHVEDIPSGFPGPEFAALSVRIDPLLT